jgi:filamentous hemagglutinin family protein
MKIKLIKQYPVIIIGLIAGVSPPTANAQLIPDSTLKHESSTIKNEINRDIIDGGAIRGTNLFHSFTDFNVSPSRGVYFTSPANISHILTRVTGGNPSNIFGTLGVLGNANLFLINPHGINFGFDAKLDVKGSFVASTADRIIFNNYQFSASNPTAPPLLNINIPLGVGLRDHPGNITLKPNIHLKVPAGKTLALIGGNISVDNTAIISPGSQVELGGLNQAGIVDFQDDFSLAFPESIARGNIKFTNGAQVNVRSGGGGSININSHTLELSGFSRLLAGIASGNGSSDAQAGNININNTGNLTLNNSVISNPVLPFGAGNAGDINITTGNLEVRNFAYFDTSTSSKGNAGDINITALTGNIILQNPSFSPMIFTGIYTSRGEGTAGDVNININNGSLIAKNISITTENNQRTGNAGNVNLQAADNISFDFSGVYTYTFPGTVGNGGNININADKILVNNFSTFDSSTYGIGKAGNINLQSQYLEIKDNYLYPISASTYGRGNAGNINFNSNEIFLDNSQVWSIVNSQAQGNGGNIQIQAHNSLQIRNGSKIEAQSFGRGNAGSVNLRGDNIIQIDGSGSKVSTLIASGVRGNAGDINIDAGIFEITNGASLFTSLAGEGKGGDININARTRVKFDGSDTFAQSIVSSSGVGNAGDINIKTALLEVTNNAYFETFTSGKGNGGNINIIARDQVIFANESFKGAFTSVTPTGVGNAGDIQIYTTTLDIKNGAELATTTLGKGDAGNILITATENINIQSGRIFSDVLFSGIGNGGDIDIKTATLQMSDNALIVGKTSGEGNAGNVRINATKKAVLRGTSSSELVSGVFTTVEATATGNAGDIAINTPDFSISNGSQVNASTFARGKAGDIIVNANWLEITEKGGIFSNTDSAGEAGDIILNIVDSINLTDSNILASTTPNSTGNGGNIVIDPIFVNLNDNSRISVNSQGRGNAGDIELTASNLNLNNNSDISAATFSGEGGNITLSIDNILRLNNSQITTEAGGRGNGGDININSDFIIGRNNSQIIANAFAGTGGNIKITANRIFFTPESNISASSTLGIDGTVETNILAVDPAQGLTELPENIEDPSRLIAENICRRGNNSQFYQTGRGGLPVTPDQVLETNTVDVELVKPAESVGTTVSSQANPKISSQEIVPARGWVVDENGNLTLVGYDPTLSGLQRQGNQTLACN